MQSPCILSNNHAMIKKIRLYDAINCYFGGKDMEALTQATFQQKLLDEQQTGLVLFFKEGCPICQEVHPLLEEIEQGYAEQPFTFYTVDAIAEEALYKSMKLQGTPTVLFYRGGQQINKFTGMREYEEIEFLIDRVIAGK